MSEKEKEYWNSFYNTIADIREIQKETTFALFIKSYISKKDRVLELGCGNGRDTYFLKQYCEQVYAIDSSEEIIYKLQEKSEPNVRFDCMDVSEIFNLDYEPTFIYSRFFMHSIDPQTENILLTYISELPRGTMFCFECRSDKDDKLPKYHGTTHYRRGINLKTITDQLRENGYEVIFYIEADGLAVYKNEDPIVIRIISRKI